MSTILLITTMYPNNLRPSTPICHLFAKQWKNMGFDVIVVYFRSMFPRVYTDLAHIFPKMALRYVGNHVEMDRNNHIQVEDREGIPVYSIPIFKYVPHGKYPKSSIRKSLNTIRSILEKRNVSPTAIIGHFYNPQLEIVGELKKYYPEAHTAVSLHELNLRVIRDIYPKNYRAIIEGVDMIGFRSLPIRDRFYKEYGAHKKGFVCWSGVSSAFLNTEKFSERSFSEGPLDSFIYVGQMIKRKFPKETIEAIHNVYGNNGFKMTFVGSQDIAYSETLAFVIEKGLSDLVSFTGKIPRENIIKYYDETQCFVMISKDEVFGLVYLEAMSRGCITIASKGEGMEGIIHDGVNGFLCEAGNTEELSAIIRHINSLSREEKIRISEAGKKRAHELSDYIVAKNYINAVLES